MDDTQAAASLRRQELPAARTPKLQLLRFFGRNRAAAFGTVIVALYVGMAVFAPWIAAQDPLEGRLAGRLAPPSTEHWLGTDANGRDLFSRVVYGARTSMWIAISSTVLAVFVGGGLGLTSGYYGGRFDLLVMQAMDVLLTFPSLVLAIALVSVLGLGVTNLILAIAVSTVPVFARLMRSAVLTVKQEDYVLASYSLGSSGWRIMSRHILPNAWAPVIVQATLSVGLAVLAAAALSFLGLGVQPPHPEWGAMLSQARQYIRYAPHFITWPGIALALLVLGFNLMGDGLRDILDPRLREEPGVGS